MQAKDEKDTAVTSPDVGDDTSADQLESAPAEKKAAKAAKKPAAKTAKAAKTTKAATTKAAKPASKSADTASKSSKAAAKTSAAAKKADSGADKKTKKAATSRKSSATSAAKKTEAAKADGRGSSGGKLRIRLKSFDPRLVDFSVQRIVEAVKKTGSDVSGPVPLPVRKERATVLTSPHKHKDARDQFEIRTYIRILDIVSPTDKTMDALMHLNLAAGVDVSIRAATAAGSRGKA